MIKKVAIVAFEIGVIKGFNKVRSAHIQLPYHLILDLKEKGYDVVLLTNKIRPNTFIPDELKHINIEYIPDPIKRLKGHAMDVGFSTKPSMLGIIKSLAVILAKIYNKKIPVIHFVNGSQGVGIFAGLISLIAVNKKVIWTPSFPFKTSNRVFLFLLKRINKIVCSTDYLSNHLQSMQLNSKVIKHGIKREFRLENLKKFRITFWRDPSYQNGADIACEVFERLAPKYPDILFTIMHRPFFDSLIKETSQKNIECYEYPYPDGITLEKVLSESLACYFPFRELSTNPQLCILESVIAGIPSFVSDIESVSEYILDDRYLIKDNTVSEGCKKIINFLEKTSYRKVPQSPISNGFDWNKFTKNYLDIYNNDN